MMESPPPPQTGERRELRPAPEARAKKPWSKPILHRIDEVRSVGNGAKTPASLAVYEAFSPISPFPLYMPQSVTQGLLS